MVEEGGSAEIKCQLTESNRPTTIWFRALDNAGMEFIDAFDLNGNSKTTGVKTPKFDYSKIRTDIMTLKSFNKERDSGQYGCATYKGPVLVFGKVTRLVGGELGPD